MFGGTYNHSLDSSGRFVMPMDIRFGLGKDFYITKGIGCLCVFTDEYAKEFESELNSLAGPLAKLLNPEIAKLHRHFFSEMVEAGTDKQFRVQLTPEHRRFAGITEEVVVCGCGKHVEIWSPELLAEYKKKNETPESLIAAGEALLTASIKSRLVGENNAGISQSSPA